MNALVKLKPFAEWTCQCAGYEPTFSREQMESVSGMMIEIDTEKIYPDPWRTGRAWRVTHESKKRMIQRVFGRNLEPIPGTLVVCEHIIEIGD